MLKTCPADEGGLSSESAKRPTLVEIPGQWNALGRLRFIFQIVKIEEDPGTADMR
jgi:hypothetical protein